MASIEQRIYAHVHTHETTSLLCTCADIGHQ